MKKIIFGAIFYKKIEKIIKFNSNIPILILSMICYNPYQH